MRRGNTIDHDWQQGHSSLLRTRRDYSPDDEIIEEEEMDEWLDRDQVAAVCPSCAEKMDQKGMCRIKASVIKAAANEARTAGIMRDPQRVVREMRKHGVEMGREGTVFFYPLSAIGVPILTGRPFKVKDIEAAVRQTAHVKDSNEEKMGGFEKLLDKLSRLAKFLRVGDPSDTEAVDTSLEVYDLDIRPLEPSSRVRSPIMKQVRQSLADIRDEIAGGDFRKATSELRDIQGVIEQGIEMWGKQVQAWMNRRQLLMAIRNLLKKHPDLSPALVTASRTAASRPNIGPGVELPGKRGVFTISHGPVPITRSRSDEYNQMLSAGYTHWVRLESPRGKELEFYWRANAPKKLFWYKNHRTLVRMDFTNVELPPDPQEFVQALHRIRVYPIYDALSKIRGDIAVSKMPETDAVLKELDEVLRHLADATTGLIDAENSLKASSRTAAIPKSRMYKLVDPDGIIQEEGSAKLMRRALKKKPKGWKIYQSLGKKIGDKISSSRTAASVPSKMVRDVERALKQELRRNPDLFQDKDETYNWFIDQVMFHDLAPTDSEGHASDDVEAIRDWAHVLMTKNMRKHIRRNSSDRTAARVDWGEIYENLDAVSIRVYRDALWVLESLMDRDFEDVHDDSVRDAISGLKRNLNSAPEEDQPAIQDAIDALGLEMRALKRGRHAAKWETKPKGWTDESRKKFWETLTGDVKHKVTKCIKQMDGKVDNPGAFCAALADRVDPGWRSRASSTELTARRPKKMTGPRRPQRGEEKKDDKDYYKKNRKQIQKQQKKYRKVTERRGSL